jgi:sugar phosphate isomerase/epimerase
VTGEKMMRIIDMKRKFYIIPYSMKSLNLSDDEFMDIVKEIGYDGIELWGVLTEEYAKKAECRGLEIVHASLPYKNDGTVDEKYVAFIKSKGIQEVSMQNAEKSQKMRAMFQELMNTDNQNFRYKGIPGAFGNYDMALQAAGESRIEAEIAARFGLKIYYHNHTHEYRVDHGEYVMDTFLRNTPDNVVMELDVGWALCAGIDVIAWMKKWAGRIGSLHVKPCNWRIGPEAIGMTCPEPPLDEGITRDHMQANQAFAESPQGPMSLNICDWASIFETAESVGCSTFIHERERIYLPGDPLACIRADYDYIRNCLNTLKNSF